MTKVYMTGSRITETCVVCGGGIETCQVAFNKKGPHHIQCLPTKEERKDHEV